MWTRTEGQSLQAWEDEVRKLLGEVKQINLAFASCSYANVGSCRGAEWYHKGITAKMAVARIIRGDY